MVRRDKGTTTCKDVQTAASEAGDDSETWREECPLGISTIRARMVQTALKLVIEPIFEVDLEPNAYGYRPKRSALDAVVKVHKLLRKGYTDVVDGDLSKYFDTIPHIELM
jgi:RNA-directed DNA polymerase